jgi:hypothetical protein
MSESSAPKRLPRHTLEITDEILQRACRRDSKKCMIVEAIRKQIPNAANISVDLQSIRWSDRKAGLRYTYMTPPQAQDALLRFDNGAEVKPFSFKTRSGHISSVVYAKGKKRTRAHKLGEHRVLSAEADKGSIVESIGEPLPQMKPQHASHNTIRTFGLQGVTAGWTIK